MADDEDIFNDELDEAMGEFNFDDVLKDPDFQIQKQTRSISRASSKSCSSSMSDSMDPPVSKKSRKQIRPKVQGEWTDDDVLILIKSVEQRRTLWDKGLTEYKLPKDSTWAEIAEIIGKHSSDDCKAKWNNLRVTFNINLAKYRSTKSGQATDEKTKIVWRYFNAMMFLESTDVRQSTPSTSSMHLVNSFCHE